MQRILAIIEREMRRYMRSPALIFIALVLPLGQLIILGNSFGGKVQGVRLAVVDEDHGPEARRVREALQSVESTAKTFQVDLYQTEGEALRRMEDACRGVKVGDPVFTARRLVALTKTC